MSQKILKKVQDDYNIIAPHFSHSRRYNWRNLKSFLTSSVKPQDKILDLGCGSGRLYELLKKKKPDYLGIDFSQELIKVARKRYPETRFKTADLTRPQTWQNLKDFDICFSIAVFHHLPNRKLQLKVLRNIYQALKPQGWLIITVWNLWQPKFWPKHLKQLGWKIKQGFKLRWLLYPYRLSNGRKPIKQVDRFCYAFTPSQLKRLLKKTGFKIKGQKLNRNFCFKARKP